MANHCYNYVSGSGSKEDLTRLQSIVTALSGDKVIGGECISLWSKTYLVFFPQDIKEQEDPEEVGFNFDVYDNWGSKWFEATFEIDAEDGSLTISGDSAWSPVLPFFIKLAQEYKLELEGYYDECGMDFAGMFTITKEGRLNDRQITSTQFRMQDNPEGFWEDVMDWISNGNYKTIDDVKDEFDVDYWGKLTEEDVVLLQDALDKFHASEKENDQETI
jgi:hypothetical protein